ncbi:MAG: hypothetical protein JWQ35_14 [Bacteriovoracaceae bacterium]|nr:hypothetical protein [Bacteriovoracaceae bacterium]
MEESKSIPSPSEEIHLTTADFERVFGERLSSYVRSKIEAYQFKYESLSPQERDDCLKRFVESLSRDLVKAGAERHEQWHQGWAENLNSIADTSEVEKIIPKYFDKYNIVRWRQEWVKPRSPKFEYQMLAVIQDWLFDKYLRDVSHIYEFGCGTGHNLFRARAVNSKAELWGLDWAASSQEIIKKLNADGVDKNIFGHNFDYFNPDQSFEIAPNSAVVTVASLEQVGNKFDAFLDYLIEKKPKFCIHIEPIAELLDQNNLLDYLSVEYFKKRNYLSGFLTSLRKHEADGKLKIIRAQRTYIGSFFIEGYSVVVWTPSLLH